MTTKLVLNWKQRIKRAEENDGFTSEDRKLIENFDTCMVGEHLGPLVEWLDEDSDRSARIEELGTEAMFAIKNDDFVRARRIYNQIHRFKRSVKN